MIEDDENYYGHQEGYSGAWNAKEHNTRIIDKTFKSFDEAYDFISYNNSKSDPIFAVMVQEEPSILTKDTRYSNLISELNKLKEDKSNFIKTKLEDRKSKRKTVTCISCSTHTKVENVNYSSKCPNCKYIITPYNEDFSYIIKFPTYMDSEIHKIATEVQESYKYILVKV